MSHILLQAVLFLALAALAGVAGNAVHPGGLDLCREYFLADQPPGPPDDGGGPPSPWQMIQLPEAQAWWESSWRPDSGSWDSDNGIYFLDARRRASFDSGHLPGAFLADPWDKEKEDIFDPGFVNELQGAFAVIVYCHGGECDDSKSVAMKLVYTHQIPAELVYIFEGGFEEWQAAGLPVETE
ncbi:MAG: hypothetical protein ISR76_01050 [Planctomycetes bacterium]|nr:hypothetical protein [Planctomycetota bacterium]MBL7007559.1 hypothetical protein [Planctomycetota bacterium]